MLNWLFGEQKVEEIKAVPKPDPVPTPNRRSEFGQLVIKLLNTKAPDKLGPTWCKYNDVIEIKTLRSGDQCEYYWVWVSTPSSTVPVCFTGAEAKEIRGLVAGRFEEWESNERKKVLADIETYLKYTPEDNKC